MKVFSKGEDHITLPESSESEVSSKEISDDSDDVELESDNVELESDSDSAPESFSFIATKENNKMIERQTAEAIKNQKDKLKRKRKDLLLQILKQREEKRQKIASKRLPDHILENIDEFETEGSENKIELPQVHTGTKRKKDDDVNEITKVAGNVTFKCKILPAETQKPIVPKNVANFKETMLYGGRVKREKNNRAAILKKEKQCIKR